VVDAFQTLAAGRALRAAGEALFERPIETILLTHAHNDHWMGAAAFDTGTTFLASDMTRQACLERSAQVMEDFRNPDEWVEWLRQAEARLQAEQDPRARAGLEKSVTFIHYALAEMAEFRTRCPDQTFEGAVSFQGRTRSAELRSLGRGHSDDDAVLLLPQDGIAFIGDVGFFDAQPFLGFCDIDKYREQVHFFLASGFSVLIPGHGPVGGREDLTLQLQYFDLMEELVGGVVQRGGSLAEALRISLPEPFDGWLMGGTERFEVNVRTLFARAGGEVPKGE